MQLESMSDFFTARLDGYDAHMLANVEGCAEGYVEMARMLPDGIGTLLDLGCGTGLELEWIYRRFPDLQVTGIDLTAAMLAKLREKYGHHAPTLICGSYFDVDFGSEQFDAAVSFESLHHFSHEAKRGLYKRLHRALQPGGVYVECDYMVLDQAEEDLYFAEYARLCQEQQLPSNRFFHYDTPCTVDNQIRLLQEAGFAKVERGMRIGGTTLLRAWKS